MKIFTIEDAPLADPLESYAIYNGLDCMVTVELLEELLPLLDERTVITYNAERDFTAPALEMMFRGMKIDVVNRNRQVRLLREQEEKLQIALNAFGLALWGQTINAASPTQLLKLFYSVLDIPVIRERKSNGEWGPSTSREALEKIADRYLPARAIALTVLAIRDVQKKIQTLTTALDDDNRIRCSYNVSGTNTGRWSSSSNAFGTGGNLQNITGQLRNVFVADPGMKIAYIDLEQAESRKVGLLSWLATGKANYLNACESGDLHTTVCRMTWTDLGWNGDKKHDREIADRIYYRDYSYRDLAKRAGHGTNYYGKAPTIARHTKIPVKLAEAFQASYFKAFPEISEWHRLTAKELATTGCLTTPLGRVRHFFGRLNDDATLRKAIAYVPQSSIGDLLNRGMWRIWKYERRIQLLAQVHDAVIIQYPEELEDILIPIAMNLITVPLEITHPVTGERRTFTIPCDCATGWNWGYKVTEEDREKARQKKKRVPDLNLDGLSKYKPGTSDPRKRTQLSILNRVA